MRLHWYSKRRGQRIGPPLRPGRVVDAWNGCRGDEVVQRGGQLLELSLRFDVLLRQRALQLLLQGLLRRRPQLLALRCHVCNIGLARPEVVRVLAAAEAAIHALDGTRRAGAQGRCVRCACSIDDGARASPPHVSSKHALNLAGVVAHLGKPLSCEVATEDTLNGTRSGTFSVERVQSATQCCGESFQEALSSSRLIEDRTSRHQVSQCG